MMLEIKGLNVFCFLKLFPSIRTSLFRMFKAKYTFPSVIQDRALAN